VVRENLTIISIYFRLLSENNLKQNQQRPINFLPKHSQLLKNPTATAGKCTKRVMLHRSSFGRQLRALLGLDKLTCQAKGLITTFTQRAFCNKKKLLLKAVKGSSNCKVAAPRAVLTAHNYPGLNVTRRLPLKLKCTDGSKMRIN